MSKSVKVAMVAVMGIMAALGLRHCLLFETDTAFQARVALAAALFAGGMIKLGGERDG